MSHRGLFALPWFLLVAPIALAVAPPLVPRPVSPFLPPSPLLPPIPPVVHPFSVTAPPAPSSSPASSASPSPSHPWFVALTFDDGPSARTTPAVLAILEQMHVPATFFVVGRQIASQAVLLRRMKADGDVIGNHSWSHPWLTKLDARALQAQITQTNRAIATAVPGYQVHWLRAPYGAINSTVADQVRADHLGLAWWTADDEGWRHQSVAIRLHRVLDEATPNGVILLHDLDPVTVQVLPPLITALRARGAVFVTVDELARSASPATLAKTYYPHPGWPVLMTSAQSTPESSAPASSGQ